MNTVRWDTIEVEHLAADVERQIIWGANANLTRFTLAEGAHVLSHQHDAEQFTQVISGALRLRVGSETCVLRPGDMLVIPPNAEHEAWAVEACSVLDFFAPRREDWREGKSGYLAGSSKANAKNAVT